MAVAAPTAKPLPDFPGTGHDHHICEQSAKARAERGFQEKGLRLTDLRRMVLEEVISSHRSLGAYEVMDRLATKGHKLAPISIYRALEALLEVGAIHRLESRNAFYACHRPHARDAVRIVLHCSKCGQVAELDGTEVSERIDKAIASNGFRAASKLVEVSGCCGGCECADARK